MKKLMMAVAIVCAAVCAQAAATKWSASNIYQMNTTDKVASGSVAYLFNTATMTQTALVTAFAGKDFDISAGSIGNLSLSAAGTLGNVAADVTGTTAGAKTTLYLALIKTIESKDYLFLSTLKEVTMNTSESTATSVGLGTQLNPSQAAAQDASKGFANVGWYTKGGGDVPEPTSGLLLLLGVAGLSLRRRRA